MKAILFDLDGTLTNNGEGIINCASLALEHYGIPVPSREEMRVFVGPPLHDTFVKFGVPEEEAARAVEVYRSRYIPIGMFENEVYPGIEEMLKKLQAQGHKLYVATSKPEWMAQKILEHFDLAKYFTIICGATMDTSRSSKSAVIAYLLAQCGGVSEAIMVGDTAYDVIGAKAHGIPTIGVSWGFGTVEDMEQAGAMSIAHTAEELFEQLQK
ncbi:MAG: HAD family hydrolase [Oscillospiraceae bacterium]|nr:HAD family hydrolase [Oscillospiraceae bacterium]